MRGSYNHGPVSLVRSRGGRGVYVGATGVDGTGWLVAPLTELNEIDSAARALNDALQASLLKLIPAPATPAEVPAAIAHAVTSHANDPRFSFYMTQWIPWKAKWQDFYADQTSVLTTAADMIGLPGSHARSRYFDAQPYRGSLIEMFQKARALGFAVPADPAPPNTPSTPSLDDVTKYLKWGAIGLAAVLGVVVITNVASATRSGR